MLVRSGITLIKYWFSITDEQQHFRFQMRIHDPLKQWKLSPMDLQSRVRWEAYTKAKEDMFERTHIPEARWWVIDGRQEGRPPQLHQSPAVAVPLRRRAAPGGGVAHAHAQSQLQARGHPGGDVCSRALLRWAPPPGRRACSDGPETFRGRASFAAGPAQAGPAWSDIMAFPLTLLDLAGAVALLLWGSHMVQTGVQRAFGPRLRDLTGPRAAQPDARLPRGPWA